MGLLQDVQIGNWSGFDIETSRKLTGFIPCLGLGVILWSFNIIHDEGLSRVTIDIPKLLLSTENFSELVTKEGSRHLYSDT
jgi:hypothetical protein